MLEDAIPLGEQEMRLLPLLVELRQSNHLLPEANMSGRERVP
jgi:hypothetical protein